MDRHIKHLYFRAGFGPGFSDLKTLNHSTLQDHIHDLFKHSDRQLPAGADEMGKVPLNAFKNAGPEKRKEMVQESRLQVRQVAGDWIDRMSGDLQTAFLEKMTLFWHGHFACESKFAHLAHTQLNTLRQHAFGNFRDLLLAVSRDGAMIRYLNNQQNKKNQPNENFARELMELFTLGIGSYTEQDIKEAARAFTGWSSDLLGNYVFRRRQHDFGSKTFMGRTGDFDGTDIIDMILEKRQTAQFLVGKMYRFFVNDEVNDSHVDTLADLYYESGYDTAKLMRALLSSDWFYAEENMGNKIKSPIEFLCGLRHDLGMRMDNLKSTVFVQRVLGQELFHPPNVAGWPSGRAWIDHATLLYRLNLGPYLIFQGNSELLSSEARRRMSKIGNPKVTFNEEGIMNAFEDVWSEELVDLCMDRMLANRPNVSKSVLTKDLDKIEEKKRVPVLLARMTALPDYQIC